MQDLTPFFAFFVRLCVLEGIHAGVWRGNVGQQKDVARPTRLQESGRWKGKTTLSKTGDPGLRKALYMPILSAWQHNPAIRAFCERLEARGKNGMAVACAAMRKMVHIAFAILKSGKPFDPEFKLAKGAA